MDQIDNIKAMAQLLDEHQQLHKGLMHSCGFCFIPKSAWLTNDLCGYCKNPRSGRVDMLMSIGVMPPPYRDVYVWK